MAQAPPPAGRCRDHQGHVQAQSVSWLFWVQSREHSDVIVPYGCLCSSACAPSCYTGRPGIALLVPGSLPALPPGEPWLQVTTGRGVAPVFTGVWTDWVNNTYILNSEREIGLEIHPFFSSILSTPPLVDAYHCSDPGWNLRPWCYGDDSLTRWASWDRPDLYYNSSKRTQSCV